MRIVITKDLLHNDGRHRDRAGRTPAREARAAERLVEEQAALRRVATLVARGVPPEEVFAVVTEEVGRLLNGPLAGMARYESGDTATVLATWAAEGEFGGAHPLVPGPWPLDGGDLASTIWRTGRAVRIDDYHGVPGRIAAFVRDELGVGSSVGSPIVVEGRLWGALFIHSRQTHQPLPRDTESRLTGFTELVATAVANAESRSELAASRARIVAASDETRRRIERDLHDGAQQRLVSIGLALRHAQHELGPSANGTAATLEGAVGEITLAIEELRELARGVRPAQLDDGLAPALRELAGRAPLVVEVIAGTERFPPHIETAAYFIACEGLTNAVKHAAATKVTLSARKEAGCLVVSVSDDGKGGAEPAAGSGLRGLSDRAEAHGGSLRIESGRGTGTTLRAELPCAS
jgi:signal transduction histidine kinase